jgi:type II secretory pathway pseudopilin PulG
MVTPPSVRQFVTRTARSRQGFTSVELAIVVILLGLLFALALPRVRVDHVAVDAAARTLNLALMSAQRDAVARSHNVLVTFDHDAHTAVVAWDVNNNRLVEAGEKTRPFLLSERVRFGRPPGVPALPEDMTPAGETVVVTLQRNGAADRAHTLYLTSARALAGGADTEARALRITRATGRPVWYAWTGTAWRAGL